MISYLLEYLVILQLLKCRREGKLEKQRKWERKEGGWRKEEEKDGRREEIFFYIVGVLKVRFKEIFFFIYYFKGF